MINWRRRWLSLALDNTSCQIPLRGTDQGKAKKIYSLLGLAARAGAVSSGEVSTEKSVKSGKAQLVVLSVDASENTKKKFCNMCRFYDVPWVLFGDKEQLGKAIGKGVRSCLAVETEGFGKEVEKQTGSLSVLEENSESGGHADL